MLFTLIDDNDRGSLTLSRNFVYVWRCDDIDEEKDIEYTEKNLLVERTIGRLLTVVIPFLQACACALNKLM